MSNYFIYLLINQDEKKTYVGLTNDLENRIKRHRSGAVKTTKKFENFDWLVLEKVLPDKRLARVAEKYWKSSAGRKRIKEILKNNHAAFVPASRRRATAARVEAGSLV